MGIVYTKGGQRLNAGYLTIDQVKSIAQYRIRIPNNEVVEEFKALTANYLNVSETTLINLFTALENKNQKDFLTTYESIFLRIVSYHDVDELSEEKSYAEWCTVCHLIMLGMCIYLDGDYTITSNRESGKGRSDILLKSNREYLPSYVIEFRYCAHEAKYMNKEDYKKHPEQLKVFAHEAINQIEANRYDAEMKGEIIRIGLAHSGTPNGGQCQDVEMVWINKAECNKG